MSKKKKTDKSEKKARVHKELEGFEIKINPLGEITSSYSIDQLNEFLDRNVHDKKLTDKGPGKTGDDEDFPIQETEEEDEEANEAEFIKKARHAKDDDDDDLDEDDAAAKKPKKKK